MRLAWERRRLWGNILDHYGNPRSHGEIEVGRPTQAEGMTRCAATR